MEVCTNTRVTQRKVINSVWDAQGKTTEWEAEFKLDMETHQVCREGLYFPGIPDVCVCSGELWGEGAIEWLYACFVEVFSFHTLM